jgi:hypothetical protein
MMVLLSSRFLCTCMNPMNRVASRQAVGSLELESEASSRALSCQGCVQLGRTSGSSYHHHHAVRTTAHNNPPTPELKTSLVSRVPVVPGRCVVPLVPAVIARGWPQIGENHSVPPPCCCSHAPAAHVLRTTSAASLRFSYQSSSRRVFPSCG